MTLPELVEALESRGVRLSLRLVVDAPQGVMTDQIKTALAAHKPALLARLGRDAQWEQSAAQRRGPALNDQPESPDVEPMEAMEAMEGTEEVSPVSPGRPPLEEGRCQVLGVPNPASAGRGWECGNRYCLHKARWWMSKYGVVQCANCKPPGFPDLVVAEGDAANTPIVEANCFRQAVDYPKPRQNTPEEAKHWPRSVTSPSGSTALP